MRQWLRRRKLKRLLAFYGIAKDEEDIAIERIDWCIVGGLLVIYRALQTEALIDGTMSIALFGNENDLKQSKHDAKVIEKSEEKQRVALRQMQDGIAEVFRHSLLKPDPSKHDMAAMASNPEIGPVMYGRILAHSLGKKKAHLEYYTDERMNWLDTIARRYGKLPSEVMALPPHDFAFCEYVAFRALKTESDMAEARKRGRK